MTQPPIYVPGNPPDGAGYPGGAIPYPPYRPTPEPRRRPGLMITSIVLVLLVLGGGGGAAAYFLARAEDGTGKATPQAAVEDFLRAVYLDQSPTRAAALVCKAARDPGKLTAKIDEIKKQNQAYDTPKYSWAALTTEQSGQDRAVLSTTVTLATVNVQRATQKLKFTAIKSTGWFVCDVRQA
jgi:hypothetical protein